MVNVTFRSTLLPISDIPNFVATWLRLATTCAVCDPVFDQVFDWTDQCNADFMDWTNFDSRYMDAEFLTLVCGPGKLHSSLRSCGCFGILNVSLLTGDFCHIEVE